ncbi:MAG: pteridine reductase [Pseudomonadota bacterium]
MDQLNTRRVALVTGGARRIGAAIVQRLHAEGWNLVIHCRQSREQADALALPLNTARPDSARVIVVDLLDDGALPQLASAAVAAWGRLDLLVNNASSFYPSPVGSITEAVWFDLMGTNLKVPLFLSQACAPALTATQGSIINIVDVHARRPLGSHVVYESAKAGLLSLCRGLARDLAPAVRVNAVAPGNILWSDDHPHDPAIKQALLQRIPQGRMGTVQDIAASVAFLASPESGYLTGQVIEVDGGYMLT